MTHRLADAVARTPSDEVSHRPADAVARWGSVVVAGGHLAIGVWLIDRLSLWGDEAFTAETVRLPLNQLLPMLTHIDVNMSAYYLLLKPWTAVVGDSETALRLPSLIMTTATVLTVAWLVSRWFGAVAGLVAAVAYGLSPFVLSLSLTARPFAMLGLLTALSVACFVRALGSRQLAPWLLLGLIDLLALYTSLLAALMIAAQIVHLVALDRRFCRSQVATVAVLTVGAVPTALFLSPADTLNWLVAKDIPGVLYAVVGRRPGLLLLGLMIAGVLLRPRPKGDLLAGHPRGRWLLPGFVVVPLLLMLALLVKQSLFTPPYLVAVFVAASMVAGAAIVDFRPTWAWFTAFALAATLVLGVAVNLVPRPGLDVQDWRSATAALDEIVEPGDTVVFPNTFYRVAAEHYERDGGYMAVSSPALPSTPWFLQVPYELDRLKRTGYYRVASRVTDGLVGRDRVWLVGPADDFMSFVDSVLTDSGWNQRAQQTVNGVTMRLFARESASGS